MYVFITNITKYLNIFFIPRLVLLSLFLFITPSYADEVIEPKDYSYGAVCDFALARLYEATQEIYDNDSTQVNAFRNSGKLAIYKNTEIEAQYYVQGGKIFISNVYFGKNRIFPTDRSAHNLLERLGVNYAVTKNKTIKFQCDMISLIIDASDDFVEDARIEQMKD